MPRIRRNRQKKDLPNHSFLQTQNKSNGNNLFAPDHFQAPQNTLENQSTNPHSDLQRAKEQGFDFSKIKISAPPTSPNSIQKKDQQKSFIHNRVDRDGRIHRKLSPLSQNSPIIQRDLAPTEDYATMKELAGAGRKQDNVKQKGGKVRSKRHGMLSVSNYNSKINSYKNHKSQQKWTKALKVLTNLRGRMEELDFAGGYWQTLENKYTYFKPILDRIIEEILYVQSQMGLPSSDSDVENEEVPEIQVGDSADKAKVLWQSVPNAKINNPHNFKEKIESNFEDEDIDGHDKFHQIFRKYI